MKDVVCFNDTKECHLKRSVTQLLGLLFPSQPQKMKPLEAVLVYQHFFVLHSLMESISRARYYVREQFEEEFRLADKVKLSKDRAQVQVLWRRLNYSDINSGLPLARNSNANILNHCFRYYAHWSRVGSKLPDGYPITRLFQRLVEGVHRMASGGCKDKSAPSLFS